MLMHADNRGVDHLDSGIMGVGECIYDTTPHAGPPPANEAVVASGIGTERIRQIAPWCSGSQDPENAIENTTVIHPRNSTRLVGQHRLDRGPFIVGEFIAHDSTPPVWEFESQASDQTQRSWPSPGTGCVWGKADIKWQAKPTDLVENDPNGTFVTVRDPAFTGFRWAGQRKVAD
jgi:hypothetical protein